MLATGEEYYRRFEQTACALGQSPGGFARPRLLDHHGLLVFAVHPAERVGDLADGCVGLDRGEDGREKIFGASGAAIEFGEGRFRPRGVAPGAKRLKASYLRTLDFRVDRKRRNLPGVFRNEVVYAGNNLFLLFNRALEIVGGALNFVLHETAFDRAYHASHGSYFFEVLFRPSFDFVGQSFNGIGACDRVNRVRDPGFVRDDLLRAQRNERGLLGRQRQSFVHRIGVQRLASAEDRGQRLNRHADDVVFGLLRGERRTGRLRMESQQQRTRILGVEPVAHDPCPQTPRRAELRDLFEQIAVGIEKERKLRRELVDWQPRIECRLDVGHSVGEGESDFLNGAGAGFANVIAGNRNGIPFGQVVAAPRKDVRYDAHGVLHRVNVRAARDVLLEDIVLDGAGKLPKARALPLCDGHVEAKEDRGRRIDGHRGRNFFKRNAVEKYLHVLERVDRHSDLAHLAERQRMIRVHADLRGQIEGDRKAHLALVEQVAVALVRFDGAPEACILAHGPETAAIHGRINAARVGKFARETERLFGMRASERVGRVQAFDRQARERRELRFALLGCSGLRLAVSHARPVSPGEDLLPVRRHYHEATPGRSQLPGAAKRTDREGHEKQAHNNRNADEPMRKVAGPGAERRIQPAEGQQSEGGANDLVKNLFDNPPEPAKPLCFRGNGCHSRSRGHNRILAHNRPQSGASPVPTDRKRGL